LIVANAIEKWNLTLTATSVEAPSKSALSRDWDTPEEDEAWANL